MNFIEIGSTSDGFVLVRLKAATEIYFEVKPQDGRFQDMVKTLCHIIPHMIKLDGDLMEAFDGGDVKLDNFSINLVKNFSQTFEFRNVECALPGFDKLQY